MKSYSFHPAANVFPLNNEGPEFDALVQSIKSSGLYVPIVLHKGKILDGRRRHLACKVARVAPQFITWDENGSLIDFVITTNAQRRQLSASQLAVAALHSLPFFQKDAKARQRLSAGRGQKGAQPCAALTGKATEQAAKKVGVGVRLVEMAKRVQEVRPQLIAEIKAGRMTVGEAYQEVSPGASEMQACCHVAPPSSNRNNYNTPAYALDILVPYLPKDRVIWEGAWGAGQLASHLKKAGYQVVGGPRMDFLREMPCEKWDVLVTNPPFDQKDKFLERAYSLGQPFAILLPITGLEGKNRHALFRKYGVEIIIPDKYIHFTSDDHRDDHCPFASAWFCWKLNLPAQVNFIPATW